MHAPIRSVALSLLLVSACASAEEDRAVNELVAQEPAAAAAGKGAKGDKPADEKAEDPEAKARKAAFKREDRGHDLAQAQMELRLAEMGAEASLMQAEQAVADANRELEEKERALAVFNQFEQPHKLSEGQLSLDRALHRRELQADELNELKAMYAAEDFAAMTKELVLKRGVKGLEFAERGLELERKKLQLLTEETLPKQARELRAAVEKAQRGVRQAEQALAKAKLENEQKLAGARHKVTKLERPLDEEG